MFVLEEYRLKNHHFAAGRIGVAAWLPDSTAVALRKVVAPFMSAPPPSPPPSPLNWGEAGWLKGALGEYFDLGHEQGELTHRLPNAEEAWRVYEDGFGPGNFSCARCRETSGVENGLRGLDKSVLYRPADCDDLSIPVSDRFD